MALNTRIPQSEWLDFCVGFSNGNCGRAITIETFAPGAAHVGPAKEGNLMAVDYDPPSAGNVLVITTGINEVNYAHNVYRPVEFWKTQRDDGAVTALEIIDEKGVRTVLRLT